MSANKHTPEIIDEMMDLLLEKSMRKVCEDERFPSRRQFQLRLAADEALAARYAEVCKLRGDGDADDIEYACEQLLEGELKPDVANVFIQSKKWLAEVRAPKKYGKRQVLAGDPEAPLQNVSDKQLDDRIISLLNAENAAQ